ncbi:MAG: NAD-dependent epimerase/dehydratase family protein, partial [Chloroflexi bacterium]|nr:NAD-dependent epimerase/dehydratase family protein [Chloroflexota bacterium]
MKYFVTGATGFIGGRLVHQLREAGHQVVAIARQPARAQDLTALGVQVVPGDVTDKVSLRAPMTGVDGVFHLAGWYQVGVRDKTPARAINVDGTRNVLEVMRELGIPKGVYTSTLAVNGDTHGRVVDETYEHDGPWLSEYDHTKWEAHYEVALPMMRQGLPLVIVQPGGVYGPGDNSPQGELLRQYLRRKLPMVPRGSALCWGHVDDTAAGHALAMERGATGQSYI